MINITVPAFQGMAPRVSPALLEPTQGVSVTGSMTSGELRPWRVPGFVEACGVDTESIYLAGDEWLAWDEVVNVHPAVQAKDAFGRLYYTRESGGLFVISPLDDWEEFRVGVPKPEAAPAVAVTGSGSGTVFDRVYVYTYVNDWGEEGAPSDPSEFKEWQAGKTCTVSGFAVPPLGFQPIVAIRLYRMAVGEFDAEWFYVDEIPVADIEADYVDIFTDDALVAGADILSTAEYDLPPENARGLVPVGSGMFALFDGNEVAFSEPYLPYAWPDGYRLTVSGSVVALGAVADSLVILTNSTPYRVQVMHPSSSRLSPDQFPQIREAELTPCISPRGVVSTEFGVVFPAPDGLRVMTGSGPSKLLTEQLLMAHEWVSLFDPLNLRAAFHDGTYFGFSGNLGFALHVRTGVLTWTGMSAQAMHADGLSLFIVDNSAIWEWEGGLGLMLGIFKSKIFRFPKPVNMAAVRVDSAYDEFMSRMGDLLEDIRQANAALSQDILTLADESWLDHSVSGNNLTDLPYTGEDLARIHFRIWADGTLRYDRPLPLGGYDRLPAGFLAREWQFEISTPTHVKQVSIGTSTRALFGA